MNAEVGAEQQRVVVARAHEGADGDEAIPAGAVLDHDRLAPLRRQPRCQQPGGDVDARSRSERHDEFHRSLRPGLGSAGCACDGSSDGESATTSATAVTATIVESLASAPQCRQMQQVLHELQIQLVPPLSGTSMRIMPSCREVRNNSPSRLMLICRSARVAGLPMALSIRSRNDTSTRLPLASRT